MSNIKQKPGRRVKHEVQRAEILSTTYTPESGETKKLFRVVYIGENGENLAPAEALASVQRCHTNIMAIIKLAHGTHMQVHNLSGKKSKKYILYQGGRTKMLE